MFCPPAHERNPHGTVVAPLFAIATVGNHVGRPPWSPHCLTARLKLTTPTSGCPVIHAATTCSLCLVPSFPFYFAPPALAYILQNTTCTSQQLTARWSTPPRFFGSGDLRRQLAHLQRQTMCNARGLRAITQASAQIAELTRQIQQLEATSEGEPYTDIDYFRRQLARLESETNRNMRGLKALHRMRAQRARLINSNTELLGASYMGDVCAYVHSSYNISCAVSSSALASGSQNADRCISLGLILHRHFGRGGGYVGSLASLFVEEGHFPRYDTCLFDHHNRFLFLPLSMNPKRLMNIEQHSVRLRDRGLRVLAQELVHQLNLQDRLVLRATPIRTVTAPASAHDPWVVSEQGIIPSVGFQFVQLGNSIYITKIGSDEPMLFVGPVIEITRGMDGANVAVGCPNKRITPGRIPTGHYWITASLADLGLEVDVGHAGEEPYSGYRKCKCSASPTHDEGPAKKKGALNDASSAPTGVFGGGKENIAPFQFQSPWTQKLNAYFTQQSRTREVAEAVQWQIHAARLIPAGYYQRKKVEMEMRRAAVEESLGADRQDTNRAE
ncbi:hypothetical protein C8J57DRAFT_1537490 [Mycena rebaudengoi]|nr:hypothetical protein C8J57DRAFT_1537490 [Mycena rebaudengoi]